MIFESLGKHRDKGILILRVGIGVMFILHGWPKIAGGPELWGKLGGAMANLGITFQPVFWGFMAAAAEFGGGICLVLGLLTRVAAMMMFFTMVVALLMHLGKGDGFQIYSHALELGIVFLGLIFIGPGEHSMDAKWNKE